MYVFGKNVVREIKSAKKIILSKNFTDMDVISHLDCPIEVVDKFKMDKIVDGNHQGVILEIADYNYFKIDELDSDIIVMLDHLEDPHNLGAIIRTCEAAGITDIILPKDRSVLVNSTVYKTSAGTLPNVRLAVVTNLVSELNILKKKGYWIIGTDMNGTNHSDIDYKGKIVIVIGNEGKGMSKLVKDNCDFIASINMRGSVNSLNASVAAGIILFEAIKYV